MKLVTNRNSGKATFLPPPNSIDNKINIYFMYVTQPQNALFFLIKMALFYDIH